MRINSQYGDKVRYTGCTDDQIKWGSHDDPREILVVGEEYTIEHLEVHSSFTRVFLQEIDDLSFNSVCFENIE